MTAATVTELVLAEARGVWVIRSVSGTVYYVDADSSLLLRVPGLGSSPGPGDNRWCRLLSVSSLFGCDEGVIRVGDRHRYLFDDDPYGPEYHWWIQRLVTSIGFVDGEELAGLPCFPQDGAL